MEQKEQKKDFLDDLTQNLMVVVLIIAAACTLLTFILQFFAPDSVDLFKQLSYYAYAWMIYLALGPMVKRSAFMKIDIISQKYPEGVGKALSVICDILMFLMMAIMLVYSCIALGNAVSTGAQNATVPAIPLALAYAAPVVGYVLAIIYYVAKVFTGKGGNK
ncbi:MAG: TRAP transporter small permease subunit [Lachnospiraceae bacterium]|nr:TRAP transporter small permease subunit [Lachnospiraceae bacterium]